MNPASIAPSPRLLPIFAAAAIAALVAPSPANARILRASYVGVWYVVFATKRGTCNSGYSVPFMVTGSRVTSAGGGRVSGSVNRAGAVAVQMTVGASHASGGGRRQFRRRLLARHHFRGCLQWHLAGEAHLTSRDPQTTR